MNEKELEMEKGAHEAQNPVVFLKTFFDFGFFLGLFPFRIRSEPSLDQQQNVVLGPKYRIFNSLPHQILCGVMQCMALIRIGSTLRKVSVEDIPNNPSVYFYIIHALTSFGYHSTFFFMLWSKQEIIAKGLNQMDRLFYRQRNPNFQYWRTTPFLSYKMMVPPIIIAYFLCGMSTLRAFSDIIMGYKLIGAKEWSPMTHFTAFRNEGKFVLFLSSNFSARGKRPEQILTADQITFADVFFAIFMGTAQLYREIEAHLSDLSLLIFTLSILWHTNAFVHNLRAASSSEANHQSTLKKILIEYEELKEVTKTLNGAFAPVALAAISEGIPFYSAHLTDFLIVPDWYFKVRFIFFSTQLVTFLVLAAQIPLKIQVMEDWLNYNRNYEILSPTKLTMLLHELNSPSIAISVSGVCDVSFTLITTILSIIVMYFIIILQLRSIEPCNCEEFTTSTRVLE